jgi:hypothetical protein
MLIFFENLKVVSMFLYRAKANIDNIRIFPHIEVRKKLFSGLTINMMINKIEIATQIQTLLVPFE